MDLEERIALINKPPVEEIVNLDIVNKPPIDELYHHGILGMKWGIRRYQNPDGTLTPAGQRRLDRKITRKINKDKKFREKVLNSPELLSKHIDKFSDEEIERAFRNFKWKDDLSKIKAAKSEASWNKAMTYVNKAVMAGDVVNRGVEFLNSPAGKMLRKKMGMSDETIGKSTSEIARDAQAAAKASAELASAQLKQKSDLLDYNKKVREYNWAKEDREYNKEDRMLDRELKKENLRDKRLSNESKEARYTDERYYEPKRKAGLLLETLDTNRSNVRPESAKSTFKSESAKTKSTVEAPKKSFFSKKESSSASTASKAASSFVQKQVDNMSSKTMDEYMNKAKNMDWGDFKSAAGFNKSVFNYPANTSVNDLKVYDVDAPKAIGTSKNSTPLLEQWDDDERRRRRKR